MLITDDFLRHLQRKLDARPLPLTDAEGKAVPFPTCLGVGWEGRPPALDNQPGYVIGHRHRPADTSYHASRFGRLDLILTYLAALPANLGMEADRTARTYLESCREASRRVLLDKRRPWWQALGILRVRPSTGVISRLPAPDEHVVQLRDEYEITAL